MYQRCSTLVPPNRIMTCHTKLKITASSVSGIQESIHCLASVVRSRAGKEPELDAQQVHVPMLHTPSLHQSESPAAASLCRTLPTPELNLRYLAVHLKMATDLLQGHPTFASLSYSWSYAPLQFLATKGAHCVGQEQAARFLQNIIRAWD